MKQVHFVIYIGNWHGIHWDDNTKRLLRASDVKHILVKMKTRILTYQAWGNFNQLFPVASHQVSLIAYLPYNYTHKLLEDKEEHPQDKELTVIFYTLSNALGDATWALSRLLQIPIHCQIPLCSPTLSSTLSNALSNEPYAFM